MVWISTLLHKNCKKKKKTSVGFWIALLRLQTPTIEQHPFSTLILPCSRLDFKVYRKELSVLRIEPSVLIDDEHSRECTMFHSDMTSAAEVFFGSSFSRASFGNKSTCSQVGCVLSLFRYVESTMHVQVVDWWISFSNLQLAALIF